MKNQTNISLYAKIHDKNVKNNTLFISNNYSPISLSKIELTDTWEKYTFQLEKEYGYLIMAKNADVRIENIDTYAEWVIRCHNLFVMKPVNTRIICDCNTLYMDNLTYNNFSSISISYGEHFKNVNNIICKKPFKLDNAYSNEIFKNYKGSYISNKFVLTDNVEHINGLFSESNIKALPTNFKINKNIIDINNLCKNCKKLKHLSIGLSGTFSKRRYPNMITPRNMFYGCKNLKDISIKFYKKHYVNELHRLSTNFVGLLSYVHEL